MYIYIFEYVYIHICMYIHIYIYIYIQLCMNTYRVLLRASIYTFSPCSRGFLYTCINVNLIFNMYEYVNSTAINSKGSVN